MLPLNYKSKSDNMLFLMSSAVLFLPSSARPFLNEGTENISAADSISEIFEVDIIASFKLNLLTISSTSEGSPFMK